MTIPLLELAAPTLRRQHSLITRRQAVRLASSEAAVRHLLDRRIWVPVDRGVYGPNGVPMTWRRSLMVASLLAPPGSVISHRAAAALHGVGGLVDPEPEISIPRGTTLRRPWLITHESTDLDLSDRCHIDGIPATGVRRLAVDLGSVVSFERYKHTIRELAYPDHLVAIEIDGAQHADRDIARSDARRSELLESLGWTIIRIRARYFASDLPGALRRLRETLGHPDLSSVAAQGAQQETRFSVS